MRKYYPLLLLLVLAVITFAIRQCNSEETVSAVSANTATRGLNRNPAHIIYSKHARCRMGCRHIDEQEVKILLKNGNINYSKSDLKGDECHKKYAVEGYSDDDQKLRIIFAPCSGEVTVVTVIDLGKEWPCDCE